ncbi:MAG TPA: DMT family transporter [Azospirillaceae bacterium]|nr:DMT family transporter [Azospirillaceae bacterium]
MRTAYLQLSLSMILVGLSVPVSKAMIAHAPPLVASEIRFALVALALAPVAVPAWFGRKPSGVPASAADWASLGLLALFGMVLFNVFLLYGLQGTSAITAGILTSTIPAMTALCAALILGERMTRAGGAGIVLAVAGIAAINLAPAAGGGAHAGASADTLLGNALVFGAVVSEALYGVFARRLGGRVAPLQVTFLANLASAALLLPLAWATADGFSAGDVPGWLWLLFAVSSLGNGALAVFLWMRGVAHVPAGRAGLFTGLLPVAAMLAAVALLGERFTAAHGIGLACVLLAIAVGTGMLRRGPSAIPPPA